MTVQTGPVGFASPTAGNKAARRRTAAIELLATLTLAVSLIIAATAVSIGMARAQAFGAVGERDGAPLAVALFFGAVLVGMGVLTAIAAGQRRSLRR